MNSFLLKDVWRYGCLKGNISHLVLWGVLFTPLFPVAGNPVVGNPFSPTSPNLSLPLSAPQLMESAEGRINGDSIEAPALVAPVITDNPIDSTSNIISNQALEYSISSVLELPASHVEAAPRVEKPLQAHRALTGEALDRTRGLSLGDALESIPGVSVLRTGPTVSKPMVRGMTGSRVVILNNGIRQEGQQWGAEHAPEIDPFLATTLTVVQGAASVRYGSDAMAGVILVDPWPLRTQSGLGGESHIAGFSNGLAGAASTTLEGGVSALPGLGWRLQGTLKKSGHAETPRYFLDNTGSEEKDFSGGIGWQKEKFGAEIFLSRFESKSGIFTGSHIGNLADLEAALQRDIPETPSRFSYQVKRPFQEVEHHLLKVKSRWSPSLSEKVEWVYSFQDNLRREFDTRPLNDALAEKNIPELQFELKTHTSEFVWEKAVTDKLRITSGITGRLRYNIYEGRPFIPNFLDGSGGLFSIGRYTGKVWEVESGLRYDYQRLGTYGREQGDLDVNHFVFQNASGSVGLIRHWNESRKLRFQFSSAFRPPHVSELFSSGLHHGAAALEYGDETLVSERAYDGTATLEWGLGQGQIHATFFHTYIQDFIYLEPSLPAELTVRGAFPTFRYDQADARFTGSDLSLHFPLFGPMHYSGKAAWVSAWKDGSGEALPLIPAARFENELEWRGRSAAWLRNPQMAISMRNVLKQEAALSESDDYAPPPEGYGILNVRAGCKLPLGATSWDRRLEIHLEVTNALDTPYRDYTNRFRYYADDLGRNIALRIKIPWEKRN
jgi:iron complex outermembrane receptor protein